MERLKKITNKKQSGSIDLTGFVILYGFFNLILKCWNISEPYRIFITLIVLIIRLFWWDKKRSESYGTLTLLQTTMLLFGIFIINFRNKRNFKK